MPVLIPAYGRTYKKKQEVLEAYEQGLDFQGDIMMGFQLCSCRDFKGKLVELRYGRKNENVVSTIHGRMEK